MKKSLMVLAASTMLLFAACNKEDNNGYTINGDKITFGMSMDDAQDQGKQAFHGPYKMIYFTEGDQIFVNHTPYAVVPQADPDMVGTTNTYSHLAHVTANISEDGRYDFMYPAGVLQYDGTNYTATFPNNVQALNGAMSNMFDNSIIVDPDYSVLPIWPMYFGIEDIENFSGRVILKHACAFISPNFTYGPSWANKVFKPITGVTYDGATVACPEMYIYDARIKSNIPLYGPARLNYSNPQNPVMQITGAMPASGYQVLAFTAPANARIAEGNGQQEQLNVAGIVPIAPAENDNSKSFEISFTFTADLPVATADGGTTTRTFYMFFKTNPTTTYAPIKRNNRYWMEVNFQTLGNSTVTYTDGLEAYTRNKGGEITFGNGTLYISSDMNAVNSYIAAHRVVE